MPSKVFYRDCYDTIWKIIQAGVKDEGLRSFLVSGTPGIGKSFLAFPLLFELRKQGATVVYQSSSRGWFRFSNDGVDTYSGTDGFSDFAKKKYLGDTKAWFLCDPQEGKSAFPYFAGITVALMSPEPKRFKDLTKHRDTLVLYMEEWTREELKAWRNIICRAPYDGSELSDDVLEQAYEIGGGIARNVFQTQNRIKNKKLITNTIRDVSMEWLSKVNLQDESLEVCEHMPMGARGGSDKLVVARPSKDLRSYVLYFVSTFAHKAALGIIYQDEISSLVSNMKDENVDAASTGKCFEKLVHLCFGKGLEEMERIVLRKEVGRNDGEDALNTNDWGDTLNTTKPFKWTNESVTFGEDLTKSTVVFFKEIPINVVVFGSGSPKSLPKRISENVYYRPKNAQFELIDSFFIRDGCLYLLQIKSSAGAVKPLNRRNTDLVQEYFTYVKKLIPSVETCVYGFVVPNFYPSKKSVFSRVLRAANTKKETRERSQKGSITWITGKAHRKTGFEIDLFEFDVQ